MEQAKIAELQKKAIEIKLDILEEVFSASSGHPGGSMSIAEILTYLYFVEMKVDPKNPKWEDRDRFVLSKGHTSPALYAVLAEKGFFPKADLVTFRHNGNVTEGEIFTEGGKKYAYAHVVPNSGRVLMSETGTTPASYQSFAELAMVKGGADAMATMNFADGLIGTARKLNELCAEYGVKATKNGYTIDPTVF